MGKRVAIVSPFRGYQDRNRQYAAACLRDSLNRGESPFAGHLMYPLALDDADQIERAKGMAAAQDWTRLAELMAVYTDFEVTPGMKADIDWAERHDIRVIYRTLPKEW